VICGDGEMREKREKGKTRVCVSCINKIDKKIIINATVAVLFFLH